jgi:two-component sensor histidine kinase
LQRRASGFRVVVQDDGVGLSAERAMSRDQSADRSRQSLGLQIIETLVTQDLGGELVIKQGERGTRAIILVEEAE